MTNREALKKATEMLTKAGIDSPKLEAEVLLRYTLNCTRAQLLSNWNKKMSIEKQTAYYDYISRRKKHVPFQYITNEQDFMSLKFHVTPDVLIPRGDTEILVEEALRLIESERLTKAADIGTGSGVIACSIAYYSPARVWAVDCSQAALAVAQKNATDLGVASKVTFLAGDLLNPLKQKNVTVDLLAANLPYIPCKEIDNLEPEVRMEPVSALDGGPDGLAIYRTLVPQIEHVLIPGGFLLLEIGYDQGTDVKRLLADFGLIDISVLKDYAGHDRVIKGRKRE